MEKLKWFSFDHSLNCNNNCQSVSSDSDRCLVCAFTFLMLRASEQENERCLKSPGTGFLRSRLVDLITATFEFASVSEGSTE